MKENYNLEKIQELINNKIEENLHLDYKASGSLEKNEKKANEISKDVSAFANSDGGVIIYGIKEDSINKHIPEKIDPIDRNAISKEWIEQIIQGRISPRIQGINIIPITINEPNEVVYVVEIPKSDTVHQANDRKYYKRFNFNSEPMYDYEIKDVLNRNKFPKIELEFEIVINTYEVTTNNGFPHPTMSFLTPQSPEKEIKENIFLNVYARNNGKVLANYINAYFIFNKKFLSKNKGQQGDDFEEYFGDNTIRDVVDVKFTGFDTIKKYGPSRYDPILPRLKFKVKSLSLNKEILQSSSSIKWEVYADNSEPIRGETELKEIKIINEDISN
ncbi:helix-turn-helix domain-containing protein [Chryseobacterium sp. G0201]|uniref:AlbA family DNA-binding domain-containing protein n=1 Tax=Chryseobacterium sp. G0201 TaxID=2487065 RepID=UPI000F4F267E|nr:ATP-binding protein [Chryseobacterium sp. G0201]AZA55361.1 ATP-binding protein [Chryseobacterium sp. G0201]